MGDKSDQSSSGDSWELPDDFAFDEAFVKGGVHEPPARTRESIAKYGGQRTSWRHGGIAATSTTALAPTHRRERRSRRWSIALLVSAIVVVTSTYLAISRTSHRNVVAPIGLADSSANLRSTPAPTPSVLVASTMATGSATGAASAPDSLTPVDGIGPSDAIGTCFRRTGTASSPRPAIGI